MFLFFYFSLICSSEEGIFCLVEEGNKTLCPKNAEIVSSKKEFDNKTQGISSFSLYLINNGKSNIVFNLSDYSYKNISFTGSTNTLYNINFNAFSILTAPEVVSLSNVKINQTIPSNHINLKNAIFTGISYIGKGSSSITLSLYSLNSDFESISIFDSIYLAKFYSLNRNSVFNCNTNIYSTVEPSDIHIITKDSGIMNITQSINKIEMIYSNNYTLTISYIEKGNFVLDIAYTHVLMYNVNISTTQNDYCRAQYIFENSIVDFKKSYKCGEISEYITRKNTTFRIYNDYVSSPIIPESDLHIYFTNNETAFSGLSFYKNISLYIHGLDELTKASNNLTIEVVNLTLGKTIQIVQDKTINNLSFKAIQMYVDAETNQEEIEFKYTLSVYEYIYIHKGKLLLTAINPLDIYSIYFDFDFGECGFLETSIKFIYEPYVFINYIGLSNIPESTVQKYFGIPTELVSAPTMFLRHLRFTTSSIRQLEEIYEIIDTCMLHPNNGTQSILCANLTGLPYDWHLRICYSEIESNCNNKIWVNPSNITMIQDLISDKIEKVTFTFADSLLKDDSIMFDSISHPITLSLKSDYKLNNQQHYQQVMLSFSKETHTKIKNLTVESLKFGFDNKKDGYSFLDIETIILKEHVTFTSNVLQNYDFSKIKTLVADVSLIGFIPHTKRNYTEFHLSSTKTIAFVSDGWVFFDEDEIIISTYVFEDELLTNKISFSCNSGQSLNIKLQDTTNLISSDDIAVMNIKVDYFGSVNIYCDESCNNIQTTFITITGKSVRITTKSIYVPILILNSQIITTLPLLPLEQVVISGIQIDEPTTTKIFYRGQESTSILFNKCDINVSYIEQNPPSPTSILCDPDYERKGQMMKIGNLSIAGYSPVTLKNALIRNGIHMFSGSYLAIEDVDLSSSYISYDLIFGEASAIITDNQGIYISTYPREFKVNFTTVDNNFDTSLKYLLVNPKGKNELQAWKNILQVIPRELMWNDVMLVATLIEGNSLELQYSASSLNNDQKNTEMVVFITIAIVIAAAVIFAIIAIIITRRRLKNRKHEVSIGLISDPLQNV